MDKLLSQRVATSNGLAKKAELELNKLSNPPTKEELEVYESLAPEDLPEKYVRKHDERIFVNRKTRLDTIEWVGFDMDYTLAVYKAPVYESMLYKKALNELLEMGYPSSIMNLEYDPNFSIRGLFLDVKRGHFIKCDRYHKIIRVVHGHRILKKKEIFKIYDPLVLVPDLIGKDYYPLNTLFAVTEACMYGDLLTHLEESFDDHALVDEGRMLRTSRFTVSYQALFQDVRKAIDGIHKGGALKDETIKNISLYLDRCEKGPKLLRRMKQAGKKLFLLTNSGYGYTNKVMTYLFSNWFEDFACWKDFFDVVIVSGQKPSFFTSEAPFRRINESSGRLTLENIAGLHQGAIYSGGNINDFHEFTHAKPSSVLYIGDHVYADIIMSRKSNLWRSMLVVRELDHELQVMNSEAYQKLKRSLHNLQFIRAEVCRGYNMESVEKSDLESIRVKIKEVSHQLLTLMNPYFGGLFFSGDIESFFSMQVERYADMYTSHYWNLAHYPVWYDFYPSAHILPHERPPARQVAQ